MQMRCTKLEIYGALYKLKLGIFNHKQVTTKVYENMMSLDTEFVPKKSVIFNEKSQGLTIF